jgi:hypothetical protein
MNTDLAFADSARPKSVVILSLRMLPYSIGHEILLIQSRNPIAGDFDAFCKLELGAQLAALAEAVWICARNWEGNQLPEPRFKLWKWRRSIRKANWNESIIEFMRYRAEGSTFPSIMPAEGEGRAFGSPFLARLSAHAQGNLDMPLGMAHWMYFANAELLGNVKVENEDETSVRGQLDQIRADYAKEKEAKCQR